MQFCLNSFKENDESVVYFYTKITETAQPFPNEVKMQLITHLGCWKHLFPMCFERFLCSKF